MARNPFGAFGVTSGWAMVATLLFLGIAVDPVDGQGWGKCDWSDYAIDSFANYVGTHQVDLKDCFPHPIEFKIMIFTSAVFCAVMFAIPAIMLAYKLANFLHAFAHMLEPYVHAIIIVTIVNPFIIE